MNKKKIRVLGDGKRECGGHALFGGDKFDKRVQPLTQRFDGLRLFLQSIGEGGKLLSLVAVDGVEQGFARREMAVKRADADTGCFGDSFEAGVRAAGTEYRPGRLEHALAVAQRVGPRFSRRFCGKNLFV